MKRFLAQFTLLSIAIVTSIAVACTPAKSPTPAPTNAPLPTTTSPPTETSTPEPTLTPTQLPTATPTPEATDSPTPTSIPTVIPVPTQIPEIEEVSFTTEDDVELKGTLFLAQGDVGVVLAHMGATDQRIWHSFARLIAGRGLTALAFDFRCYGLSDCDPGAGGDTTATDVRAAVGVLRERGFERIVCMGASFGGAACMNAALYEELVGLVVIASLEPTRLDRRYPEDLVCPAMPKLFIVAEDDPGDSGNVVPAMSLLYERSPEPKQFNTFPGTAHGTTLFETQYGDQFQRLLLNFLEGLRSEPAELELGRGSVGDTWTRPADGMVMVYVPAGKFAMGSSDEEVDDILQACNEVFGTCERWWYDREQPVHTVTLDAFWIDQTEVTNAQFAAFLSEQGNQLEGEVTWLKLDSEDSLIEQVGDEFRPKSGYADHPVTMVSWYGAAAYCERVGGRLPTEAEWEYAARGPDGHLYPWGDTFDGSRLNYCDANCEYDWKDSAHDDGYAETAPVGSYPGGASWCGALDMAGNVWEWVADWYNDTYYARSPAKNPQGPGYGDTRIIRGGTWEYYYMDVRSTYRGRFEPWAPYYYIGFRCSVPAHAVLEAEALPVHEWTTGATPSTTIPGIGAFEVQAATPSPPTEMPVSKESSASQLKSGRGSVGDTWTRPADGMVMVYVPAGEFQMGSDDDEMDYVLRLYDEYGSSTRREDFERERPAHSVALDGFWIDQTKVTNAQFAIFLNEQGNQTEGRVTWLDLKEKDCLIEQSEGEFRPENGYADHPVMEVSWYGAAAYCEWAGARLPTEAEWEYAARGPEEHTYPWGDDPPTCEQAQFRGCPPGGGPVPVGSLPAGASWCNAQDMAGNVWEWVADWLGEYPSERQVNPTGPSSGDARVLHGGSWASKPYVVRSAFRYRYQPYVTYNLGFRCARSPE